MRATFVLLALLLASPVNAAALVDTDDLGLDLSGDVKGRFFVLFPYEHLIMPEGAQGQATAWHRTKLKLRLGRWMELKIHHDLALDIKSMSSLESLGQNGAGATPEAFPGSWQVLDDEHVALRGRLDRLSLTFHLPHVDVALGRQPVSFGSTWFFTPLDLVAPFTPTTIDREYKPGVDALRVDAYLGWAAQVTALAAYAGSWDLDGTILAAHGRFSVGAFDLSALVGSFREDAVFGLEVAGGVGGVGLKGAITLTVPPDDDEDPFVRGVVGVDYLFDFGLSLMAEVYAQSIGTLDSADYMSLALSDRFSTGELWTLGHFYAALSAGLDLTPLLNLSLAVTGNLLDPSVLIAPGLNWSVSDNVSLSLGGYLTAGERPVDPELEDLLDDSGALITDEQELVKRIDVGSEFGLVPSVVYLQMSAYF